LKKLRRKNEKTSNEESYLVKTGKKTLYLAMNLTLWNALNIETEPDILVNLEVTGYKGSVGFMPVFETKEAIETYLKSVNAPIDNYHEVVVPTAAFVKEEEVDKTNE